MRYSLKFFIFLPSLISFSYFPFRSCSLFLFFLFSFPIFTFPLSQNFPSSFLIFVFGSFFSRLYFIFLFHVISWFLCLFRFPSSLLWSSSLFITPSSFSPKSSFLSPSLSFSVAISFSISLFPPPTLLPSLRPILHCLFPFLFNSSSLPFPDFPLPSLYPIFICYFLYFLLFAQKCLHEF